MNATTVKPVDEGAVRPAEQQFVLLNIGEETYGIEIGLIHGIIMPQGVTEVPKTPAYVKGVTNLRGNILPVIDMRQRFGLAPASTDAERHMRFIVVETRELTAALIVDAVSEVARMSAADIDAPSQLLSSEAYECISGVGKLTRGNAGDEGKRLIMVLDVDKLLEHGTARLTRAAL